MLEILVHTALFIPLPCSPVPLAFVLGFSGFSLLRCPHTLQGKQIYLTQRTLLQILNMIHIILYDT